jgi:hypothetical protein
LGGDAFGGRNPVVIELAIEHGAWKSNR